MAASLSPLSQRFQNKVLTHLQKPRAAVFRVECTSFLLYSFGRSRSTADFRGTVQKKYAEKDAEPLAILRQSSIISLWLA